MNLPSFTTRATALCAALYAPLALAAGAPLDAAARKETLNRILAMLEERYVAPENIPKIARTLKARQAAGAYDKATDAQEFAKLVTADLYEASRDGHMSLSVADQAAPGGAAGQPVDPVNAPEKIRARNYDFRHVEVLDGNVGYMKIDRFANPELAGPTATAAMAFVANTDALIFDLRDCKGGGRLVHYLATYMFRGEPQLFNSVTYRHGGDIQFWGMPYVPGARYADNPVYILTSKRTNSGCEAFTNILKNLRNATLVGEVTRGAGNPNMFFRLDDRFELSVPIARATDPANSWEGKGVQPTVPVPETAALATARRLAVERLLQDARAKKDAPREAELAKALAALPPAS